MGASDLPDTYAQGLRAYTSGKLEVPMLQVICITSGTINICPNLWLTTLPIFIIIAR